MDEHKLGPQNSPERAQYMRTEGFVLAADVSNRFFEDMRSLRLTKISKIELPVNAETINPAVGALATVTYNVCKKADDLVLAEPQFSKKYNISKEGTG